MIAVTGDIHGAMDIGKLDNDFNPMLSNMTKEDFVLICGDFGLVWSDDEEDRYWRSWLDSQPYTTLFIDGNHENFDLLNAYEVEEWHGGKVHRISDSIIHLMRGQVYEIDGKKFFTMGGASSQDIELRELGVSYWEEELPNDKEYEEAVANLDKSDYVFDYIITHCAPTYIEEEMVEITRNRGYEANELTDFLEEIAFKVYYKKWYCGHYHVDRVSEFNPNFRVLYNDVVRLGD
ncbi:MAG: metallophosphatase family protein [Ruminococcus sp.]|nr:metallophosphatase family protein [Ruminococcus sp.]